ncbi:MAG: hypothetical protein GY765_01970, partial [bacterium]|nr:hypothetical protein [bacterium]
MDKKKKAFLERLLVTFRLEADEHIKTISNGLIQLEKNKTEGQRDEISEVIYREAHSLKGAARSVDRKDIESVCQTLENILRMFKHKGVPTSPAAFDALHRAVDLMKEMVVGKYTDNEQTAAVLKGLAQLEKRNPGDITPDKAGPKKQPHIDKESRQSIIRQVEERRKLKKEEAPGTSETPGTDDTAGNSDPPSDVPAINNLDGISHETVRLSTDKLDAVLRQAEEMVFTKLFHTRLTQQLFDIRDKLDALPKIP